MHKVILKFKVREAIENLLVKLRYYTNLDLLNSNLNDLLETIGQT